MAIHGALTRIVAGVKYFIHPQVLGTITGFLSTDEIRPIVLIGLNLFHSGQEKIASQLDYFDCVDDVYSKAFAETIVVAHTSADEVEIGTATPLNYSGLLSTILYSRLDSSITSLPSGPYFLRGSNIHQAWRLYPDELDAFNYGVVPQDVLKPQTFDALTLVDDGGIWRNIAVPSRLYTEFSSERPLAGARLSIKDIFRLKGVKSTMVSRAFTALYEPEQESGDYVTKLLGLGAIIVGKTKMTQFASSDEPTDQQCTHSFVTSLYARISTMQLRLLLFHRHTLTVNGDEVRLTSTRISQKDCKCIHRPNSHSNIPSSNQILLSELCSSHAATIIVHTTTIVKPRIGPHHVGTKLNGVLDHMSEL
ncbi:hypothetical protein B7494_g1006 [Chlorociboria aeruginascens]|nr:hypothetical protein B7494_g1006 [Chlorociboria aeruginascens]